MDSAGDEGPSADEKRVKISHRWPISPATHRESVSAVSGLWQPTRSSGILLTCRRNPPCSNRSRSRSRCGRDEKQRHNVTLWL